MRSLLIYFLTVISCWNVSGQSSVNEIKVLSWNIYMLPAFPIMTGQVKRAHGIVEVLKAGEYDVICFQEAFHRKSKRIIDEGLRDMYPHQVNTFKKGFTLKATSGLWVLSKYPIEKIAEIEFVEKKGWDAQSKKGAILFELQSPKNMYFIDSHLQSGVGGGRTEIRKSQCTQILNELIRKPVVKKIPVVMAGDWNTKAGSDFDNAAMKQLFDIDKSSDEGIKITWPAKSYGDPGNGASHRIFDLIMLKDIQNVITHFECRIPNLKYKWKKSMDDLADHLPVAATIRWED